ncbi:SGNH/GDSL hydrolase family protein [Micromonospora sp. LZ34]
MTTRRAKLLKRVVLPTSLVLAVTVGVTAPAGYLAFVRSPQNSPADACRAETAPDAPPVVVAAGASITQGTLGGDWVGALRNRPDLSGYTFVNAGVNGNTSADLLSRVDTDIVACRPTAVTILVGTNDVRNGVPVAQYRDNLTAIVDRIQAQTDARIALASLPPLGEDLTTGINQKLAGYNAAIRQTAEAAAVDYLPVHERMALLLVPQDHHQPYAFSFGLALWAAVQHYTFRRSWDQVARSGDRTLFVDHIHLSDHGAAQITELAANWLTTTPASTHPPR